MVRCRPGIVEARALVVPDQQRTASRFALALHRIRDTCDRLHRPFGARDRRMMSQIGMTKTAPSAK
jgi:hypothetical protein